MKVYFECPFNFRASDEVIYYFCFANGLNYSTAQELKEKASAILEQAEPEESKIEFTTAMGAGLKNIHTKKELLQYIAENSAEFLVNNRTAYFHANELLNECTDLAKKFFDFENEFNFSEEKNQHHAEKKQNVDLFLYMLFGIDLLQYKKAPMIIRELQPLLGRFVIFCSCRACNGTFVSIPNRKVRR